MKNKITKSSFGVLAFGLSLLFVQAVEAAPMNIMKDAEAKQSQQERCEKSQERTAQLIKVINDRLEFEAQRNKHHQDELAKRSDDERASYLNAVIITRSQVMTDIENFLTKASQRLELISGSNICSGVADSGNKQYAAQLREASRKLHEEYEWLDKKVQPTTTD